MRVVSWNLAANTVSRSAAIHERAWHYLEGLDPDLALLQEASPPTWATSRPDWQLVHRPYERWVSAILAKAPLRLVEFDGPPDGELDGLGYLATGLLTLPDGERMLIGSVHTPIGPATAAQLGTRDPDAVRTARYRVPYRRDVAYAIYRDRGRGGRFLVGGDWNIARLWDELHSGTSEIDFFERAELDGWVECYRRCHPEGEGQTWFRGSDPPYQLDHVFCDATTGMRLVSCTIDPRPARELGLSDHAPMILEFDL